MKLTLKEYNDGTPVSEEDQKIYKTLSISGLVLGFSLVVGVVVAIIEIVIS